MERELTIPVSKKFKVRGKFNGSLARPLVVIVHGLPGNTGEGFYIDACKYFAKHGFSIYRFNLYDWHKDSRQLISSTLKTHRDDLDAVVRYFRRAGTKKIYVCGHSFGGPTILLSKDQDFDAVALWDPSFDISFAKMKYGYPGGKYVKELNGYLMSWGANVVIGKAMADEVDNLKWSMLAKNFHAPLKIIAAGKGVLVPGAKEYFKTANHPKDLSIIKGATHYFDDTDKMQEKVFKMSKDWFRKF